MADPEEKKPAVSYPVFNDRRGNRFVFPGLYSSDEDGKRASWGECMTICAALGVTHEKDHLIIPIEPDGTMLFEHVKCSAGSSGFMHGSSTVYLISGPDFDAVKAEPKP